MANTLGITGPAIISEATLRTRDLAPAFLNALHLLGDDAAYRADLIRSEYHDIFVEIQNLGIVGDVSGPATGWLMSTLFDSLDEFAPAGTYFGSSEGDGACFGFWSAETVETWHCAECDIGGDGHANGDTHAHETGHVVWYDEAVGNER